MLDLDLPKEFDFLQRRKEQLLKELAEIEALEANLLETRQLLDRTMDFVGTWTKEEFASSWACEYQRRFLDGKLEYVDREFAKLV